MEQLQLRDALRASELTASSDACLRRHLAEATSFALALSMAEACGVGAAQLRLKDAWALEQGVIESALEACRQQRRLAIPLHGGCGGDTL